MEVARRWHVLKISGALRREILERRTRHGRGRLLTWLVDMGQVRRRHVKASGPPRTTSSTCLVTRADRRLGSFDRKVTAFKAIAGDTTIVRLLILSIEICYFDRLQ